MGCGVGKESSCQVSCEFNRFGNGSDNSLSGPIVRLNKGGLHVITRLGSIQYGIPPESIKDSMIQGMPVPEYYIISREKFDIHDGISLIEFEFPVYYNFFIRKEKKTKIICDSKTESQIRLIFQETLLGPVDMSEFDDDFVDGYDGKPDIRAEMDTFTKNPFDPSKLLSIDALIEFVSFDESGTAKLQGMVRESEDGPEESMEVRIVRKGDRFYVYENQTFLTDFCEAVTLDQSKYSVCQSLTASIKEAFEPPLFGITILGSSHGFDSLGSTSGFIIWVGGRGIMVDPPPYSSRALRAQNIPPSLIEKIIITHCHADHDSGAFHKILESTPVEFITTKTIIGSFLRKYSAIIGVPEDEVASLFQCRTVVIGHPTFLCGARFIFDYSFHSIPALCFEVEYKGKRFFFSGDTFYDPPKLQSYYEKGLFTRERYERLTHRDLSKFDMILHEAGVPPIHTPLAVLELLPSEIKRKLFLIHIASKDVPNDSELRCASAGLNNSQVIIQATGEDPDEQEESILNLLSSLEIMQFIPFNRITEILECFAVVKHKAGDLIVKSGAPADNFYVVKQGTVHIYSEDKDNHFSKLYLRGDFFGESALLSEGARLASIVAVTDVELLVISKFDFLWIFNFQLHRAHKQNPVDMLGNLAEMRRAKAAEFINMNPVIERMTENQKCVLNMYIEEVEAQAKTALWNIDSKPEFCYFIKSGKFQMIAPFSNSTRELSLNPGALIGDFESLLKDKPAVSSVQVIESGSLFRISKQHLLLFIKMYPGFSILCRNSFIIN